MSVNNDLPLHGKNRLGTFLARLRVSNRFLLVLAIGFVFQASISIESLVNLKRSLIEDRTSEVKHLLETGYSILLHYHDQVLKGQMTDEAAREAARDTIRALHFDNNNYFFIWDLNGKSIVHGAIPALEGKTFIDSDDAVAKPVVSYMVRRLLEVAKSPEKEGVTTYKIPKAGQSVPMEKISYSRLFEPWGWSIGTGAYIDDIDATFYTEALMIFSISAILMALAGFLTYLIGRDMARSIQRLTSRVNGVVQGELKGEIPEIDRRDEIGEMARALSVFRDTSIEAAELRLDHLTGLAARRMLVDNLGKAMARSSRSGNYGALLLIDLDKFKGLNDTHGHDAGDLLLKEVARRLVACTREGDTVARLGGDEFVVLLVDINPKMEVAVHTTEIVATKILSALRVPYVLGRINHQCSASIGATLFFGIEVSSDALLKQADLGLYKAKDDGRNVIRFFESGMEKLAQERLELEKNLNLALDRQEFVLHYQAQLDHQNVLIGAEALIRWQPDGKPMVGPDRFIPLAEETGLIMPIGRWVLDEACRQLARWSLRAETAHLQLAVNISARQFQQRDFVEQVLAAVHDARANPAQLKLELTESLLVRDVEDVIAKMTELRATGIRFALDDFGTGYSSLALLKRLPLDELKIDKSFVAQVLDNANDAAIAKMIIILARTMGLQVIAEGVETIEQRDFLAGLNCQKFQGYLFSRPLPIADFERMV